MMPSSSSSSPHIVHEMKTRSHRFLPLDAELLSIPDEQDEAKLDQTTEYKITEEILLPHVVTTDTSKFIRPWSDLSAAATTRIPMKKYSSRHYKFVQLEQSLQSANFFKNNHDRNKFEHEYRVSLQENKFEEFLQTYSRKLQLHKKTMKQEYDMKTSRTFTFVGLEKNFLALDPTRDIKIIFVNNSIASSTPDMTNIHPTNSIPRNSTLSVQSIDAEIEAFYESHSRRLLQNPSRARDEITLFARQAAEHLHERLPGLSHVPYRVKIIDERDKEEPIDERTLLQMKHKYNLSLISKRRQLIMKMITQTKKNQIKMKQFDRRTPLTIDNLTYCRELLERVDQIEQTMKAEHIKHPQIDYISRKNTNYSSGQSTIITPSIKSSVSSRSTPFQDALSMHHVEKTNNVHVLQPTRPSTVLLKKSNWINYC